MGRAGIKIWRGRTIGLITPAAAMPVTNSGHDGFSLLASPAMTSNTYRAPAGRQNSGMSWNHFHPAKIAACNKSLRMAIVSPTPSTEKSGGKRSEPAMERMQLRRFCAKVAARRIYCRQCGNIKCLACCICRIQ
ncbi:hypothetical protein B0H14DRAFT_2695591 [Mycena olivaceomarginata]|nr:hypothetical protein B0H14DRAFT_2695591 [Mycena olivaceomarginata]